MNGTLQHLNTLPREEACAKLLECCGSKKWAERTARRRPFRDSEELLEAADRIWWELDSKDWLEAFRAHPKIGERGASPDPGPPGRPRRIGASQWSREEQSGAHGAPEETLAALAKANRTYEDRFGYIFIVCATGKTAGEMLQLLEARLKNNPEAEILIAAEQQRRITRLRLEKLLKP